MDTSEGKVKTAQEHTSNEIGEKLFAGALYTLSINYLLYSTSNLLGLQTPLRLLSCGLLICAACFNFKKIRLDLLLILILGKSMLTSMLIGVEGLNLLLIALVGMVASSYGMECCRRILYKLAIVLIALYIILWGIGLIHPGMTAYSGRVRNTLGFTNVNAASLFFIGVSLIPLSAKKKRILPAVASLVFILVVIALTDTRSALLFSIALIALCLLFAIFEKKGKLRYQFRMAQIIVIGAVVMSLILPLLRSTPLDALLSFRPSFFYSALKGLSIIEVMMGASVPVEIDNSYLLFMLVYGAITLLLLLLLLLRSVRGLAEQGEWIPLAFVSSMVLLGLVEGCLYRPEPVVTLAFWSYVFLGAMGARSANAGRVRAARSDYS